MRNGFRSIQKDWIHRNWFLLGRETDLLLPQQQLLQPLLLLRLLLREHLQLPPHTQMSRVRHIYYRSGAGHVEHRGLFVFYGRVLGGGVGGVFFLDGFLCYFYLGSLDSR